MSASIDIHPVRSQEPEVRMKEYVVTPEHGGYLAVVFGGNTVTWHRITPEQARKLADAIYDAAELVDPLPAVPADMAERLEKMKADLPTWSEEQRLALSFFMDELMGNLPTPEDFPPEDIEPCPCEQAQE